MNRIVLAGAIACAALVFSSWPAIESAQAQPAFAVGKWLPDGTMAPGTITVRVVAGGPQAPVIGTDVTLVVGDQPRTARTDSSGRATFGGLTAGAAVQAKILDTEQKEQVSEPFAVPAAGGARVMLSTKPFTGGGGMPSAPAGMPEARQMSGQPRADRGVAAGTYQVRLTYNNLQIQNGVSSDSAPPVGETVTLVGYTSDDKVEVRTATLEPDGHVQFENLDVSGNTAYFVLARLPRGGGVDRLMATPIQPDGQAGLKLILSGEKRDSGAPPVDDLANPQTIPTPGKVRVVVDGFLTEAAEVVLVDAATKAVIARGMPGQGPPNPSNIQGQAQFNPATDLPKGTLAIKVHGGAGAEDAAIADVPIRVIPADADQTAEGIASKTGGDGSVQVTVPADKQYKVVLTINGKGMVSTPFDLSKTGGKLDVVAKWEAEGKPEVMFDVAYKPGLVLYAETTMRAPEDSGRRQVYRTLPFQPLEAAGTNLSILVYPRVLVRFSLRAFVEDDLLAVRGQFAIENHTWAPYRASNDGMVIPLPRGFKGAGVAEENQADVSVAQGEGLRILRPLPPMGRKGFVAGFSLKADGGEVQWALDLPLGTFQSGMEIKQIAGMKVNVTGDARAELLTSRDGVPWYVIDNISIKPKQSMVMTITGLPSPPMWKAWAQRIVFVLAIGIMLGGIGFALMRKPSAAGPDRSDSGRRTSLLDELVDLERTGKDPARKDQVVAELEKLWRD